MAEDLATFGLSGKSARHGDVQHFGGFILDMLFTIYASQRGMVRPTVLYAECPSWCSCLWARPESWAHISNEVKLFNVTKTWMWAAVMLGKLRKVSHVAWLCVLTYEANQGTVGPEAPPALVPK
eukprot:6278105-Amphidinium_carterae.1